MTQQDRSGRSAALIWGPIAVLALLVGVGLGVFGGDLLDKVSALAGSDTSKVARDDDDDDDEADEDDDDGLAARSCRLLALGETSDCDPDNLSFTTKAGEQLELQLSDGTRVVLAHGSKLELDEDSERGVLLRAGEAVIEVEEDADAPPLLVRTSTGRVEVTGTRLVVVASPVLSVVAVLEGHVVAKSGGDKADVTAGSEAVMLEDRAPLVKPSADLEAATAWAQASDEVVEAGPTGLGRLTARKPGAKKDTEQALRLVEHQVRVSVQGAIARTEIEEAFANDSQDTLEGVYTFPLPAGARIAALDLLVEDEWEHGAIVERERGQKIWRGVIRQATPKKKRAKTVKEEWIWVPGPWRDPALLEWKQGNQFQLRIYPIPGKGVRRVRIAYTETLPSVPGGRRYVLPLAADPSGRSRAELFRFQARIGGVDADGAVRGTPYQFADRRDGRGAGRVLAFERSDFEPQSDIVLSIPDPAPTDSLQTWAYTDEGRKESFVLLELEPPLPAWPAAGGADVLFVVDHSYATQRERLERAAAVVADVTGRLAGHSRVQVLACATRCKALRAGGFQPATRALATALGEEIRALRPLGASHLEGAIQAARAALGAAGGVSGRSRVVYVGDGIPTVGELDPGRLAGLAGKAMGEARLTTVSVGGQVDDVVLDGMARAGGGRWIAQQPGDSLRSVAYRVLDAQLDRPLVGARLTLPEGVTAEAPAREDLGTIWPGERLRIAGRVSRDVEGHVVLFGTVAGEPFERRWPVKITPSTSAGNAFLPRVWAEQRIKQLQATDTGEGRRDEIVKVSKRYHVLSRYTSLLVLESEAMARAFGVEATRPAVEWSGDEASESTSSDVQRPTAQSVAKTAQSSTLSGVMMGESSGTSLGDIAAGGRATGGLGSVKSKKSVAQSPLTGVRSRTQVGSISGGATAAEVLKVFRRRSRTLRACHERVLKKQPRAAGRLNVVVQINETGRVSKVTVKSNSVGSSELAGCVSAKIRAWRFPASESGSASYSVPIIFAPGEVRSDRRPGAIAPRPRGAWVKRTKTATRQGTIRKHAGTPERDGRKLAELRASLAEQPASRDRTERLARWHLRMGQLDEARQLVEGWLEKDRMDAGALIAAADIAAAAGNSPHAVELLASAVEVDPWNTQAHERMVQLYEGAGDDQLACAHTRAAAQVDADDRARAVAAVRCAGDAERYLSGLSKRARRKAEKALKKEAKSKGIAGSLVVTAEWSGGAELDVLVVTPKGRVISRLGGEKKLRLADSMASGKERLATPLWELGRYQLLVVHPARSGDPGPPAAGKLKVKVYDETRTLPFETDGLVARVADIRTEVVWK